LQAKIQGMFNKSVEAMIISNDMLEVLYDAFEKELFMQECLRKVLPYTCYHACETAMIMINPLLIPYD